MSRTRFSAVLLAAIAKTSTFVDAIALADAAALPAKAAHAASQPAATQPMLDSPCGGVARGAPAPTPAAPADRLFLYRYTTQPPGGRDVVRLRDGTALQGKALEWATQVLVYDAQGRQQVLDAADVERIETNAWDAWKRRPAQPDLTVAFVERLPRNRSWRGLVRYDKPGQEGLGILDSAADAGAAAFPPAGQDVKFVAHVRNVGGSAAQPFAWRISVDDQVLAEGRVDRPLDANAEAPVEAPWKWQDGQHVIRVELDTGKANEQSAAWNNTFIDFTRAQSIQLAVPRRTYDAFRQCRNLVDTFCLEDWAQYHVRCMNALLAQSVYPSAPDGILERLRIDDIRVEGDGSTDQPDAAPRSSEPAHSDASGTATEFGCVWAMAAAASDAQAATWAGRMNWRMLFDLGRELGLIDLSQYDVDVLQCLVRDSAGRYLQRKHDFPWPHTLMHTPGPYPFSEVDAGYLNKTLGRPRGFSGDFQYAIPRRCILEIRGIDGRPAEGVAVDLYQRRGSREDLAGFVPDDKLVVGRTGADGRFVLPNRAAPAGETPRGFRLADNPFGKIDPVGMNGVLLAHLSKYDAEGKEGWDEWHFLSIFDFNLAFVRGMTEEYVHPIQTHFAPPGGPKRVDITEPFYDADLPAGVARFRWPHWGGGRQPDVAEYRVYQKSSLAGDDTHPMTLIDVVRPNPPEAPDAPAQPHVSLVRVTPQAFGDVLSFDRFFSVSAVGLSGAESLPSEPMAAPAVDEMLRCAAEGDHTIYIPVSGNPDCPMYICSLVRDFRSGKNLRPFGLRAPDPSFRGYRPAAAGATFDAKGLLIVADARHHQVAWYDRGRLVRLVGNERRDATAAGAGRNEFNQPSDVAVDSRGRVYVADRMNHRLVILDANGEWLDTFGAKGDGSNQFDEPFAISCVKDNLAVTEWGNKRVAVYDVSGPKPDLQFAAAQLTDPDRAVMGRTGLLYICDRWDARYWGIKIYRKGDGSPRNSILYTGQGLPDRPRGLCLAGNLMVFVNARGRQVQCFPVE